MKTEPNILDVLRLVRAVPVIRSKTTREAVDVGNTLADGGMTVLEITYSVPAASDAIAELAARPGVTVGAGTILTEDEGRRAVAAGALFLVSPVWLPWLPELSQELGVPFIPGASTPTEIWNAWNAGAAAVKVFPIARLGGAAYIKDLLAPLPKLQLMATGGVSLPGAVELVRAGCLAVGLGSLDRDTSLGASLTERARTVVETLTAQ